MNAKGDYVTDARIIAVDPLIAVTQEWAAVNRQTQEVPEYPRRLREALSHRDMSARELARRVGIGETPLGRILNGETVPSTANLAAICKELRVYPSWVLEGFEPRYYEEAHEIREPARKPMLGVERWLAESSDGSVSADERAWLMAIPWLAPHVRQSDAVYQLVLLAYRQMTTSPSSAALEPVTSSANKRVG